VDIEEREWAFPLSPPRLRTYNIIVDDDFKVLSLIDWEQSFVAPPEMAAWFPRRLQIYPEAIIPLDRDQMRGFSMRCRGKRSRSEISSSLQRNSKNTTRMSLGASRQTWLESKKMSCFLIRRWENRMPWLYNYQPGIEDDINLIIRRLREDHEKPVNK
jgi:hypothetical protein